MDVFKDILRNTIESIKLISEDYLIQISDVIVTAIEKEKKILVIGIGECSADAQHIATELTSISKPNHAPIRALSLTNVSEITYSSTDYDTSIIRFITTWGDSGDVLIAISSQSDIDYILEGVELAKSMGLNVISLSGNNSDLLELSDYPIEINSFNQQTIQNGYIIIAHFLITLIERGLFNSDRKSKYRRDRNHV